jgi:hypothetical protein
MSKLQGPKGQDSIAQALAWVSRLIARGPEGGPLKRRPRNRMSNRILCHRKRIVHPSTAGRHPSLPRTGELLNSAHSEIRGAPSAPPTRADRVFFLERTFMSLVPGPLAGAPSGPRAKKRKTQAKARLKPGLNYLGPSGRKTALTFVVSKS